MKSVLDKWKFYSMQCDGSTDSGNVEVFLVMYCDPHAQDGRVHVCNKRLAFRQLVSGNAEGLYDFLTRPFDHTGSFRLEKQVSRTRL